MVEYKVVPNNPGYRVGTDGSAWTRWRQRGLGPGKGTKSVLGITWRRMKIIGSMYGYGFVNLRGKQWRFGRLMLETFVGPCPEGMECRHLDGNKSNNCLDNLAWGTPLENAADRDRHQTTARGEAVASHRFTETDVREMYRLLGIGWSQVAIARKYSTHLVTVNGIFQGRGWRHIHEELAPTMLHTRTFRRQYRKGRLYA